MTRLFIILLGFWAMTAGHTPDDHTTSNHEITGLPEAFKAFDQDNTTIYLDGDEVVIETNGMPNHASPYWSNTTERKVTGPGGRSLTTRAAKTNHPLFVEPTATSYDQMAPSHIDDFHGSYTLRIPLKPEKAKRSYRTGLGPIGIAVSGAMIYNDEEGPGRALDWAASSLDFNGAHTGPQSYHYHLEPKSFSNDDDHLIGVMADGFLLYGRKENGTDAYPGDLDESGGHVGPTQHNSEPHYHYHVQNELYINKYYILFPGNYQGKPSSIH